jgi:hypothetical protein
MVREETAKEEGKEKDARGKAGFTPAVVLFLPSDTQAQL